MDREMIETERQRQGGRGREMESKRGRDRHWTPPGVYSQGKIKCVCHLTESLHFQIIPGSL